MLGKLASDGTRIAAPAQRKICSLTCTRYAFQPRSMPFSGAGSRSLLSGRELDSRPVMALGGQTIEDLPEPGILSFPPCNCATAMCVIDEFRTRRRGTRLAGCMVKVDWRFQKIIFICKVCNPF